MLMIKNRTIRKKIEQIKKYDDEQKKILDDFRMKIVKHTFY